MRDQFQSYILIKSVLIVFLVTLSGCAASGEGTSGSDPTVITQEDIEGVSGISDVYNLVQRLHPQWLQKRGRSSVSNPGDIIVYVEDTRYGNPESLRRLDVIDVQSIEFLRPEEATMRYGSGHDDGVIYVHLKEGER